MDLKNLSMKQKVLLFGGGFVVLLFLWKAVTTHAATTSATSAVDPTGQLQNILDQYSQANQQQGQAVLAAITQSNQGITQAITQGNQSLSDALANGMTGLANAYKPTQTANPVSVTPAPSHPTLSSYDQTVNAKGGQWLTVNGKPQFAAGHYIDGNTFIADNKASQSIYNSFEQQHGYGGVSYAK